MSDQNLKQLLEDAFAQTPDIVRERMQAVAQKARTQRKARGKRMMTRVLLAALIVLSVTGLAAGVMNHYGVFNFRQLGEGYNFTLPEAQEMVYSDLCDVTTGNIAWQVREAAYDGRVLRIVYSMRDLTATEPFDVKQYAQHDQFGFASQGYYELGAREGVSLRCDGNGAINVNGQDVNLMTVEYRLGELPGEYLVWIDCRMEYYDQELRRYQAIYPEGTVTVEMPFLFQGDSTEGMAKGLRFEMDVSDYASRFAVTLPSPYTLKDGAVITFSDIHFSPATVVFDYEIALSKDMVSAWDEDTLWDYNSKYWTLRGDLVNEKGETLGVSGEEWAGLRVDEQGNLRLFYHAERTPSTQYTKVNYLLFGEERVPIPLVFENSAGK